MRIYNFSAGPAVLPSEVVKATKKALIDYNGTGIGIMEISHRSDAIIDLFCKVNELFCANTMCLFLNLFFL